MIVSPRAKGGTSMEDTELDAMLLGIKFPWRVNDVQVDIALNFFYAAQSKCRCK